ncbi:hypothetical protein HKT18_13680 [Flavobacterium sp. IMCC34852]|uniref:Uncharacterized protein n=1 Tax=Flavobacterium rivulicola TaxID=2732161 RepID=A0A7Y3RB55_9FLAO|nr:hypothetical protein [Flavobacterium sp. IMCC34852]NNT73265.1 hypothetical protein [Flavobacterium sp. IMCC34852]
MCQYNFLILENNALENVIIEVGKASNFRFQNVLTKFSIPNLHSYVTDLSEDNCNCGSVIGCREWKEEEKFNIEKEKKKLERKRYSNNRIERLLIQKQEQLNLRKTQTENSEYKEADKWIKFFHDLKKEKLENKVGLIFHHYCSQVSEELVKIEEDNLDVEKLTIETLKSMVENKLYWINYKASR